MSFIISQTNKDCLDSNLFSEENSHSLLNPYNLDARKLFGEFTKAELMEFENHKNKLLMEEEDKTINLFYMELDEVDEKMPCIQYELTELESTLTKNKLKREFKQTSEEESNQSFLERENDDLDAFFKEERLDNLGAVFAFSDEFRKKKGDSDMRRYQVNLINRNKIMILKRIFIYYSAKGNCYFYER